MDDMHPFERQVAAEVVREMLPSRPVDAAAVIAAVDVARSPTWRFGSMISATKVIVAGAILALSSGFLLTGVLTQPSDEQLPAVGASASAQTEAPRTAESTTGPDSAVRTDILPGVSLTVEEVEPGLFRVSSDGVRDLADAEDVFDGIAAGVDGSVWISRRAGPFRLGDARRHDWPRSQDDEMFWNAAISVDEDGAIWRRLEGGQDGRVRYDGTSWTNPRIAGHDPEHCNRERRKWCVETVAVGADGTVWVTVLEDDAADQEVRRVARLRNGRWHLVPGEFADVGLIGASGSGAAWIDVPGPEDSGLGWFEKTGGKDWDTADMAELFGLVGDAGWDKAAVGPDGALWVYRTITWEERFAEGKVARLSYDAADDAWGDWVVFDSPGIGVQTGFGPDRLMEVAPDGSLWVNVGTDETCGGVAHFAGGEWTDYLDGACVRGLDVAADGTVWLQARDDSGPIETYVITPDTTSTAE